MVQLPAADIRRAVRAGLEEDLGEGDLTTAALQISAGSGLDHCTAADGGRRTQPQTFLWSIPHSGSPRIPMTGPDPHRRGAARH